MGTVVITNNLHQNATKLIFQYTNDFSVNSVSDDETKPFIQAGCNVSVSQITEVLNRTGTSYDVVSIFNGSCYIIKRTPSNDNLFVTEIETRREVSTRQKTKLFLGIIR